MRRRLSGVWVPLITVLLTCPLFASKPPAVKDRVTLQAVDASAFPAARPSDPVARSLPTLKTRPLDRQPTPWGLALAATAPPHVLTGHLAVGTHSKPGTPARGPPVVSLSFRPALRQETDGVGLSAGRPLLSIIPVAVGTRVDIGSGSRPARNLVSERAGHRGLIPMAPRRARCRSL